MYDTILVLNYIFKLLVQIFEPIKFYDRTISTLQYWLKASINKLADLLFVWRTGEIILLPSKRFNCPSSRQLLIHLFWVATDSDHKIINYKLSYGYKHL